MPLSLALTIASMIAQGQAQAAALIRQVEAATSDLRDFKASIIVDRVDALTEELERRTGRVVLETAGESSRRFAILLDRFIGPDGRVDESRRHYIYEAGWFAEIDLERRQFVNRQIVAPGESFDPLRVGEGPLPIPIGQRADDVMARFAVAPVLPPDRGVLRSLQSVRGVRLTPKPGLPEADETESVDLFYDDRTLLPRGVIQRRRNGDRVEVLLREPSMNSGIEPKERELLSIRTPDPGDGWAVDVRPWKRAGEPMDPEPMDQD